MSTVLVFDELGVGQQVSLSTNDRGTISGQAQDTSTLGGASLGYIAAPVGNLSFNGDGSGGAQRLSGITTVHRAIGTTVGVVWNFKPAGVVTGALVFINVTGFNAATLELQNNGATLVILDDTNPAFTTQNPQFAPFPVLVFDGTNWALNFSAIQDT